MDRSLAPEGSVAKVGPVRSSDSAIAFGRLNHCNAATITNGWTHEMLRPVGVKTRGHPELLVQLVCVG